ncbi:MAG TPA: lipase maturation factor family protein [Gemmatimonadales bacterium]|nr:lipase maturation factor family protein [Gemmatimonadales bacterium]
MMFAAPALDVQSVPLNGEDYALACWLFLRALGAIYGIAFVSLWVQVHGLIGSGGILPLEPFLGALRRRWGRERYRLVPTLFWLRADDRALHVACAAGVGASVLLTIDVAPAPCLVVLWALYLSLSTAGRDFLAFQWDVLLLEAGLLAVFLTPWGPLPGPGVVWAPPGAAVALLWWLLFRLMFQSGVVKLLSGDPTWRNLTALHYHYFTQPLPPWTAWYLHQTPSWFKKASVMLTYVIEIILPLLIFGPPEARLFAGAGMVVFQLLIVATGNYNFFNLLAIALCIPLAGEDVWRALLPEMVLPAGPLLRASPGQTAVTLGLGGLLFLLSAVKLWLTFFPHRPPRGPLGRLLRWVEPFRSVNSYGLFRVMTVERPEIIVEGSDDGVHWLAYEFRHKPGDPARRPGFVAPHQPRLDWQMWFAALSRYELTPWFAAFLARLLQGAPDVLRLLRANPFLLRPPRYVRALLYDYRFTTPAERRRTGAWWTRRLLGPYSPVLSLGSPPD